MGENRNKEFLEFLLERFKIEREKFDRSGVYAYTQRLLAYNSNKIEGSTLTEEQTASLFDHGILPSLDKGIHAPSHEIWDIFCVVLNQRTSSTLLSSALQLFQISMVGVRESD